MPPDVQEESGGALCVHFLEGTSIVLPGTGVKGRVSSVSDHPSTGWERPKQAGWEFRH